MARIASGIAVLLAVGCQEMLPVGTERLPPPDVEIVDEGDFSTATEPCGALAVSPPVRLSGTATDSTRPAIAVVGADRPEPRLLVMWIEDGETDDPVRARMLQPDGSFLGPLARLQATAPSSIAIAAIEEEGSFLVALADAGFLYLIPLARESLYLRYRNEEPSAGGDWTAQRRWRWPDLYAPRIAVLSDRTLTAALGPDEDGDGESDTIQVLDAAIDDEFPRPCPRVSETPSSALDIVADGDGARLVWIHDGELHGAELTSDGCSCLDEDQCTQGWWAVPADTEPARANEGIVENRIRSVLLRSSLYVTVAREAGGAIWVWSGGDDWDISLPPSEAHARASFPIETWEEPSFAIAVEPGRRRLALARPVSDDASSPAEIEIERGSFASFEGCDEPLSCTRLTADLRDSHEPEMVELADGFGVVWSDEEADGQREIYYAKVTCAALPRD